MNFFEKILYFLQGEMTTPVPWGWFHILCLTITAIAILFLYSIRRKYNDKQLKIVLGVYSIIALTLETLKQLIWAFNYDVTTNIVTWDYEWYAFPFQLCTTPIFICLICLFLKPGKTRSSLLSYLSFITILGSISSMLVPESCFVSDILVNLHTMWLHYGSFVISVYLLMNKEVKLNIASVKSAIAIFLIFIIIAQLLNLFIYNIGVLNGETFNMFYISPYFISSLPVFDVIQQNVPYLIYLLIYIIALSIGAIIIYHIAKLISLISKKYS